MVAQILIFVVFGAAVAREYPGMYLQQTDPNIADRCFAKPRCDTKSRYRTIDGSCNNLRAPTWGKAGTPTVRLLPPRYADGVNQVPQGLPNTREISLAMFRSEDNPSKEFTTAAVAWGQAIAHDTSFLIQFAGASCCQDGKAVISTECASIDLSPDDPAYQRLNRTCMELIRAQTTQTVGCNVKPAQQLSGSTHFLDLSLIYGSTDKVAQSLRVGKGGQLLASNSKGKQFCPFGNKEVCDERSEVCYRSGDPRVNQNLELTTLSVIFLREHNRITKYLARLYPYWNDERLYQEARRINIAKYQKISYYDFLPLLTGFSGAGRAGEPKLDSTVRSYSRYDPRVNPSTIDAFSAGCYRYFHTLIANDNAFYNEDGRMELEVPLKEWFNRPDLIVERFDSKVIGMTRQPSESADRYFTSAVHEFLYKMTKDFGDDLEAIDIQRGRDFGLPPYNQMRQLCGGSALSNITQLFEEVDEEKLVEVIQKISGLYGSIEEVDLMVGILAERRQSQSLMGPTCTCIIGEQFRRWKDGDRFWYENEGQVGSFTKDQISEIQKASLSRLLCDNTDITEIQRYAFYQVSDWNPLYPCREIPRVDLLG